MKKSITLFLILMGLMVFQARETQAQRFAVGGETGINVMVRSGTNVALPIGGVFEWAINDNMTLNSILSFDIGLGKKYVNIFNISPEFRYYIDGAYTGFYGGAFLGFGGYFGQRVNTFFGSVSNSGGYFGVGGVVGYSLEAGSNLIVDVGSQIGLGLIGSATFMIRPTVAIKVPIN